MTLEEMQRLKEALPSDTYHTLVKHEADGDYYNPEYLKAVDVFYRNHVCRLDEWPRELVYSVEHLSKPVYETMNGPNEFTIIGNIRYWDTTSQLQTIRIPTLVTCGRYDEVSPKVAKDIHKHIKGSKLVIFTNSAHLPFWEERTKYIAVLRKFLDGGKS
jgi:proline iminopeptidase